MPRALAAPRVPLHLRAPASALAAPRVPLHLPRGLACPRRASRAPASARDVSVLTVAGGLTGPADPAPFPRRPRPASAVGPQAPHTSMPGKARVFALASLGKTLSEIVPILLWILLLDSIQDAAARPNFDRSLECRGCSILLPTHSHPQSMSLVAWNAVCSHSKSRAFFHGRIGHLHPSVNLQTWPRVCRIRSKSAFLRRRAPVSDAQPRRFTLCECCPPCLGGLRMSFTPRLIVWQI